MRLEILISTAVACFSVPMILAADVVVVCEGARYERIQKAVNEAPEGSVITVCAGKYHEQVTISKSNLTLRAQGEVFLVKPAASSGPGYGFTVLGANTTISGFRITGFTQTTSAGILVKNAAGGQLSTNLIYGNCNGILLSNAIGTSILNNNVSQNPYPLPVDVTPQPGIPPPPSPPTGDCKLPIDSTTLGPDGYGIKSNGAGDSRVTSNDVQQNGECGIQTLNDDGGSRISGNHLFANSGSQNSECGSIDVRSPRPGHAAIVIANNNINTGTNGILLKYGERLQISGNQIVNTAQGINLIDSNLNTVTYNATTGGTTGIVLTGRDNQFGHNNASGNSQGGFFVTVDGCPPSGPGIFRITADNRFTYNTALNNGGVDVFDYSSRSGMSCDTMTTPITTRDTWIETECRVSVPSSICHN